MRELLRRAAPSVLSGLLAAVVCFAIIAIVAGSLEHAGRAALAMLWGAIGDWPRALDGGGMGAVLRPLGEAGTKAALLTLTGLSVAVAFRVGIFNIGAQGQLVVGAISAAALGAFVPLPSGVHVVACLLAAAVAGGLFAGIAAWLRQTRGVHEVISTIMLNWVAVSLVDNWLVVGPLRAVASADNSIAGTPQILPTAELPRLLGDVSRLNAGVVLALVAALLIWRFFTAWRRGFEWRAVGLNAEAAKTAGIDVDACVREAMVLSGALAGVAGAVLVLGTEHRYPASLGAPYGFDGIAMALLGGGHPLGTAAAATIFGALRAGGTRMQLVGVHKSFPELIQGLALVLVAARALWQRLLTPKEAPHG